MTAWTARTIAFGGETLTVHEAGPADAPPVLILHDELGVPAFQKWHGELAKTRRLILPALPGFTPPRIAWVWQLRDLIPVLGTVLRDVADGPVDVIGISLGGWIAAEMAVQNPAQFKRMVLVAPFGIKVDQKDGVIADMFLMTSAEYIRAGFADPDSVEEFGPLFSDVTPEVIEAWEDARIETAQLGWQPYMHSPAMAQLLPAAGDLPTLVVWGDKDVIVPRAAAAAFADGLPGGRLEVLAGIGHHPELEDRNAFLALVEDFLATTELEAAA